MNQVRYGIIGVGGMGSQHAHNLYAGKIKNAVLTAVCDISPDRIAYAKENWPNGVAYFDDAEALMTSGLCDAVFIATPHYDHPPLAIKAFSHGLHVMSEKPAGVYTLAVEEMNTVGVVCNKSAVAVVIHVHTEVVNIHILAVHAHYRICRTVDKNKVVYVNILGIYCNYRTLIPCLMGEYKAVVTAVCIPAFGEIALENKIFSVFLNKNLTDGKGRILPRKYFRSEKA